MAQNSSTFLRLVPVVLGFGGLIAALALGIIHGQFLPWHFALGGLALISLIGGLAWLRDVNWRQTLISAAYSVFFVLCVALVYLISANREAKFDLTSNRVHTLSQQTLSFLENLPAGQSLIVQIFAPREEHEELKRFLQSYSREAPEIQFSIYDPDQAAQVLRERSDVSVEDGTFFVTSMAEDGTILQRSVGQLRAGQNVREHLLTNALVRAVLQEHKAIYFTVGHGERALTEGDKSLHVLTELIKEATLPVRQVRLMEGQLPDDAAAIVIAGPTTDFFPFEISLLENYLLQGGKLLVLMDPLLRPGASMKELEGLLTKTAGITPINDIIVDPIAVSQSNSNFTPLVQWSDHPIALATPRTPFLLLEARPLAGTPQKDIDLVVEAILGTTDQVWTEPAGDIRSIRRISPPDDPAERGVRFVALAAERPTPQGRYGNAMKVVVLGDTDALTDRYLIQNETAGVFVIQSLNWLRERADLLKIPPRMLRSTPVSLTSTHLYAVGGLFLLIGLAVLLGGTAWTLARRRTR